MSNSQSYPESIMKILDYCDYGDPNLKTGKHVDPLALRQARIQIIRDKIQSTITIQSAIVASAPVQPDSTIDKA